MQFRIYSDDGRLKFVSVPAAAGKCRFCSNPNPQSATTLLNHNSIRIVYNMYENIMYLRWFLSVGQSAVLVSTMWYTRSNGVRRRTRRQRGAQRASSAPGGRSLHHTHTQYNNILIYVLMYILHVCICVCG